MSQFEMAYTEDGWVIRDSSQDLIVELSYVLSTHDADRVVVEVEPNTEHWSD